ncbi:MAG: DNA alkylation repair protein [Eubacteriales bacterium]|nr:DNA alkylation repair protein [Eubacteriales bacterium]MDD3881071.1 DNA alkylation repair protein [Eubacteriales bacterium]MDD4511860.1 DNA alkylation repair protein [Eubacteriales bacterium]
MNTNEITSWLIGNGEEKFADFQSRLIPNIERKTMLGVRTPALRSLAKELNGKKASEENKRCAKEFMRNLPHRYFDENALHAFLIEQTGDFAICVSEIEAFLPYVDNWAVCDQMSPKALGKEPQRLKQKIREWLASGKTYTVRFALGMIMSWFLDESFDEALLAEAADIKSGEYYVNMMNAWLFATALAKQYESAVKYIEEKKLDVFTHNAAIRKAAESRRVSDERKAYLKTLKTKA